MWGNNYTYPKLSHALEYVFTNNEKINELFAQCKDMLFEIFLLSVSTPKKLMGKG